MPIFFFSKSVQTQFRLFGSFFDPSLREIFASKNRIIVFRKKFSESEAKFSIKAQVTKSRMSTPSGVVTASSISTTASVTSSVGSAPGGGNSVKSGPTGPSTAGGGGGPVDRDQIYQWILELASPETRETALLELSKKREVVPDLAPMLWHSYGTIAALLQEIIAIYPAINPPVLTAHQSNRVCNALGN